MKQTTPQTAAREALRKKTMDKNFGLTSNVPANLSVILGTTWKEDIFPTLEKVEGFSGDVTEFQIVDRRPSLWSDWSRSNQWVKPDFALVEQAAVEKQALCVNKCGQFRLFDSEYAALSHTWSEGLYANNENLGLPRSVLDSLFKKLEILGDVEWVWMDSLAVPGGDRDLSVVEEKIKIALINNMGNIYTKAATVIVLDALVLNLRSNDPVDVAFCLLCGRWRTRMWTYQEGRLASHIKILTGSGAFGADEIIAFLEEIQVSRKRHNLGPKTSTTSPQTEKRNVGRILEQMKSIFGPGKTTLVDVWRAGIVREAGQDIDYARAMFPVLGLSWSGKFNRELGMATIYRKYLHEAVRFIPSYGSPRLIDGPGWAPSYLNKLDYGPWPPAWEDNGTGIETKYCCYKIRSVTRHKTNVKSLHLEFDQGGPRELLSWAFTHEREREEARLGFAQAVQDGSGVLLIADPLYEISRAPKNPFSFIVVLARQMENSKEVQVFLTARIYDLGKIMTTTPALVTFSHKSPFSHETPDELDEIQRGFNNLIEYERPFANKVHEYVRSDQEMPLRRLLDRQKGYDVSMTDQGGWTALDWAVIANPPNIAIITVLLEQYHGKKSLPITPLILATAYSNETVIQLLFDTGFTQHEFHGVSPLTQALWCQSSSVVIRLLIAHGANVDKIDEYGRTPIFYAKNLEHLNLLLDAGADPSSCLRTGRPALHTFAINGWDEGLKTLVEHGAAVDLLEKHTGYTALYHAVKNQNETTVRVLLKQYANPNRPFEDGKTLLMYAVESGNLTIVENLLEFGAQIDVATTERALTPFHIAINCNKDVILNKLLEQPQSTTALYRKDKEGLNPYQLAEKWRFNSMEKKIQRRMKKDGNDWVLGLMLFGVLAVVYLTLHYLNSEKRCLKILDRNLSHSLLKNGIEPHSTSLSVYFHAVFSFQFLFLKSIVIFLVIAYNLGRREEKKFEMWLRTDRKRFELYWKNSGERNKVEHFYTILGGAVILVILSYIAYQTVYYFGTNTTIFGFAVLLTIFLAVISIHGQSKDPDMLLGFIILTTPPWAITAIFKHWLHWQIVLKLFLSIVPSFITRTNMITLLEGDVFGRLPNKKTDNESKYPLDHFAIDFVSYCIFASVGIKFGWASFVLFSVNFALAVVVIFTSRTIADNAKRSKLGSMDRKDPEKESGKTRILIYAGGLIFSTVSLGLSIGFSNWLTTVAIFLNFLAGIASLQILLNPHLMGERMSKVTLLSFTLLILTEIEVIFGSLKAGLLSLLSVAALWIWWHYERKTYSKKSVWSFLSDMWI